MMSFQYPEDPSFSHMFCIHSLTMLDCTSTAFTMKLGFCVFLLCTEGRYRLTAALITAWEYDLCTYILCIWRVSRIWCSSLSWLTFLFGIWIVFSSKNDVKVKPPKHLKEVLVYNVFKLGEFGHLLCIGSVAMEKFIWYMQEPSHLLLTILHILTIYYH